MRSRTLFSLAALTLLVVIAPACEGCENGNNDSGPGDGDGDGDGDGGLAATLPDVLATLEDTPLSSMVLDGVGASRVNIVSAPQHGALDFNSGDAPLTVTYTPDADYFGPDPFVFRVRDPDGNISPNLTVPLVVESVNDAPQADPVGSLTVVQGSGGLVAFVHGSDVDDADINLDVLVTTAPDHGTTTINTVGVPGQVRYTPTPGYVGTDAFEVAITDDEGALSSPRNVSVTVVGANTPPVATAQSASDDEDTVLMLTLTGTDAQDAEDALSVEIAAASAHGTLNISNGDAPLDVSFTPDADFVGATSFTFTLTDSQGLQSAPATVSLNFSAVNDAPVVAAVAPISIAAGMTAPPISLTATDVDDPITSLTIEVSTPPAKGLLSVMSGTSPLIVSYTPATSSDGPDSFSVTATDPSGAVSVPLVVQIDVIGNNAAPMFTTVALGAADEDAALTHILGASDPNAGDLLTFTAPVLPAWMTLTDNGDGTGTLTGTPDGTQLGDHTLTVVVTDEGGLSAMQTSTVTVSNVNDAPTFTSAPIAAGAVGTPYSYAVTTNDEDAGDTRTITASTLPGWLTLLDNGDGTASLTGSPTLAEVGDHDVVLVVADVGGLLTTQAFTLVITDNNAAPAITSTAPLSATEDTLYTYALTAADVDVGDSLLVSASMIPAWLTVSDAGDGSGNALVSGTPTNADVGAHDVTLVVSDGNAAGTQAFTITVANVNDAPTFTSTAILGATAATPYSYAITVEDVDVGDMHIIEATTALPAWLTLTQDSDLSATLQGTPTLADVGAHPIDLLVTDTEGLTDTQSFTLSVSADNVAPSIDSTAVTAATEGTPYTYNVTSSDPDVGDVLVVSASTLPAWLTLTDAADGSGNATLTGTPDDADGASAAVTLVVTDDGAFTGTQSFTIVIAPLAEAPSIDSAALTTATEDTVYTYNISASDPDVGDALVVSATTLPPWLTLTDAGDGSGNATLTGTPDDGDITPASVALVVTDADTLTDTQSFSIVIAPVNDPPVGVDDAFSTAGNTQLIVNGTAGTIQVGATVVPGGVGTIDGVLANDTDVDTPLASLTVVETSATTTEGGQVTFTSDGGFIYHPAAGFAGTDTFTYTVHDGSTPATAPATVSITVSGTYWYVDNTATGADLGTDAEPFDTLADAEAGSDANDSIIVTFGGGVDLGQDIGIVLVEGQRLYGEASPPSVTLYGQTFPLLPAGGLPLITNTAAPAVLLGLNSHVEGLALSAPVGVAEAVPNIGAATLQTLTITSTDACVDMSGSGTSIGIDDLTCSGGGGDGVRVVNSTLSPAITGSDIGAGSYAVLIDSAADVSITDSTLSGTGTGVALRVDDAGTTALLNVTAESDAGRTMEIDASGAVSFAGTTTLSATNAGALFVTQTPMSGSIAALTAANAGTAAELLNESGTLTIGTFTASATAEALDVTCAGALTLTVNGLRAPNMTTRGVTTSACGPGLINVTLADNLGAPARALDLAGGTFNLDAGNFNVSTSSTPLMVMDAVVFTGTQWSAVNAGVDTGAGYSVRLDDVTGSFGAPNLTLSNAPSGLEVSGASDVALGNVSMGDMGRAVRLDDTSSLSMTSLDATASAATAPMVALNTTGALTVLDGQLDVSNNSAIGGAQGTLSATFRRISVQNAFTAVDLTNLTGNLQVLGTGAPASGGLLSNVQRRGYHAASGMTLAVANVDFGATPTTGNIATCAASPSDCFGAVVADGALALTVSRSTFAPNSARHAVVANATGSVDVSGSTFSRGAADADIFVRDVDSSVYIGSSTFNPVSNFGVRLSNYAAGTTTTTLEDIAVSGNANAFFLLQQSEATAEMVTSLTSSTLTDAEIGSFWSRDVSIQRVTVNNVMALGTTTQPERVRLVSDDNSQMRVHFNGGSIQSGSVTGIDARPRAASTLDLTVENMVIDPAPAFAATNSNAIAILQTTPLATMNTSSRVNIRNNTLGAAGSAVQTDVDLGLGRMDVVMLNNGVTDLAPGVPDASYLASLSGTASCIDIAANTSSTGGAQVGPGVVNVSVAGWDGVTPLGTYFDTVNPWTGSAVAGAAYTAVASCTIAVLP